MGGHCGAKDILIDSDVIVLQTSLTLKGTLWGFSFEVNFRRLIKSGQRWAVGCCIYFTSFPNQFHASIIVTSKKSSLHFNHV